MDTQTSWSRSSITNVALDTINSQSGNASKSGSNIIINKNGSISFLYSYGHTEGNLRTNKFQLNLNIASNNSNEVTRYNTNLAVDIQIQYYEEVLDKNGDVTGYTDGQYDCLSVFPYITSERDGYIKEFIVDLENKYIKNILVTFRYDGENTINIYNPRIYYSMDAVDSVKDAGIVGSAAHIANMSIYDDGIVVYYEDNPTTPATVRLEQYANNVYIVSVSGRYTYNMVLHDTNMPYDN